MTPQVHGGDSFDFEDGSPLILRKSLDPLDQPKGAALELALEAIELFRPALEPSCLRLYLATREPPEGFYRGFASPSLWRLCAPALPMANAPVPLAEDIVDERVVTASAATLRDWAERALAQPCPAGTWNTLRDMTYEVFAVRMTRDADELTLHARGQREVRRGIDGWFPAKVPGSHAALAELDIVNIHDGVEWRFVAGCSDWLEPGTVSGQALKACVQAARQHGWRVVSLGRDWPESWQSMVEDIVP